MSRTPTHKKRPAILAASIAALLGLGLFLSAPRTLADEYWDGTTTTGSGDANGQGGSGTWDSAKKNWVDITGHHPAIYNSSQLAIFSTTGGTVTLGANETFTALRFDANGYNINPGTGPFTLTPSAGATITTKSKVAVTINPVITGGGSITAQGSGTITLTGANNYSGGTTLTGGTLNANNNSAFGTGTLTINGGTIGTTAAGTITVPNHVVVGGDFSVATPGNTNYIFSGTVDLGGATRTITGLTPGAQIQFGNAISNGGITFTTDPSVGSNPTTPYVAYIYTGATPNTYTGLTTVDGHAIVVFEGTSADGAIQGDVTVNGNGSLDYILGGTSNQIKDSSTVTINSPGTDISGGHVDGLALRGLSDTIGTLNGSSAGKVGLGSGTLTISVGGNFAGVIEDGPDGGTGGKLTMAGTGTLILSGANTYTGATAITSGTLRTGAADTIPLASTVTVNLGATFDLNGFSQHVASIADGGGGGGTITLGAGTLTAGKNNSTTAFSGNISGTGGLTKVGTGTLTLTGLNAYSGATTVTGGTLLIDAKAHPSVLGGSSALVVGGGGGLAGGTFQFNGVPALASTQILNGLTVQSGMNVVAVNNLGTTTTLDLRGPGGTAGITRTGNGLVDFRAITGTLGVNAIILTHQANDVTGIIGNWATVNGGSALAANNGAGVIVAFTNYTGIDALGPNKIPDNPNSNIGINALGTVGPVSIAQPLTRINTLTQNFTTASTIDTSPGTLQLGQDGSIFINSGKAALTIGTSPNSGILTSGTSATPSTITFANFSGTALTINSKITDNAGGQNSVRLTGTGLVVFAGTNTYSGSTTILDGTLRTDAVNSIPSTSTVTIDSGGTLNLNNFNQTVASISNGPNGSGTISLGSAALTTGGNNASTTFSGVIQDGGGGGSLVKVGAGTLTLSGANTYSGGTTLANGGLTVNSNSALGTGTLTITSSGGPTTLGSTINNTTLTIPVSVKGNFSVSTAGAGGNGNFFLNGPINLNGGTRTITGLTNASQVQFGGGISNGGVNFNTAFTATGDYVAFIMQAANVNTYTGPTTVNSGAFLVFKGTAADGGIQGNLLIQGNGVVDYLQGNSSQIADTAVVTVNSNGNIAGGVAFAGFDMFNSTGDKIGSLNGTGTVALGAAILTIGTNNLDSTFNGSISDGSHSGISGGGITKIGTGKLILGGPTDATSYTGPTTISAGTLETTTNRTTSANSLMTISSGATFDLDGHVEQVGGIADGTGAGTISLGSGILVTGFNNKNDTFSGIIQDGGISGGKGGSLINAGTATLTLSGANTYTGATEIFGGTIRAGKVDAIPLKSAILINKPATFDLNNLNQSVGSIADDVSGGGTIELGTATLTTGNDNTSTFFSGLLNGTTGGLTKVGTGTLVLLGNSVYTGPTLVSAGTLVLASQSTSPVTVNGGATFSVASDGILKSGVTVSNTTGVATIANFGEIDGAGGIGVDASASTGGVKIANFGTITGTVKLGTGANTIVVATQLHPIKPTPLIPGGPGSNNTLELAGSAQDSFNLATATNFEFLHKVGGGLWILTGTKNFPSGTTISGGTVAVQGNLNSNVVIQSEGALAGTGFATGSVFNAGTVMPGSPSSVLTPIITPGTLSVKGSYTQSPAGALVIQMNGTKPGQYSQLSISGQAQLNGALVLQNGGSNGLKLGDKLTILTAGGGVSGTFSDVTNPFATGTLIVGKIVYEPNDVALEAAQGSFLSIDSQFHLTLNQKAVATTLDSAASDPRATQLLTYLDNRPLKRLPGDFDLIAPEEMASVYRIGISLADVQARNLQRRTADLRAGVSGFSTAGYQTTGGPDYSGGATGAYGASGPDGANGKTANASVPDLRWGTFITGVGDFVHVGDSANGSSYDLNTGGVTVGADYKVNDHLAVGLTAGYVGTNANLTNDGRLLVNGGKVGVYGTYYTGGFHTDAAVTGGYSSYSTRRSALQGDASGRTEGGEVDVLADAGYDWRLDALTIGPTAAFQYTSVGVDGFTERGSLAPLRYAGQQQSSIRSTLGIRMAYDWKVGNVIVRPEGEFAWQHEYGDRSYSIDSALASGAGSMFSVQDTQLGRDSLLFGGGVSVLWNPRTSTYLYYDADLLKKEYYSQSVTGGLRMNF